MPDHSAQTHENLALENEELRYRLQEAEELITAIRTGAVDALAVQGTDGPQIYTLQSADQGYRTLIEQMNEGAMLLSEDATILYCNACLATWMGKALEEVIGESFARFIPVESHTYWDMLVAKGWTGKCKGELALRVADGSQLPLSVSMNVLTFNETPVLAVIATSLSAQEEIKVIRAQVAEQNVLLTRKNQELQEQEEARQLAERAIAEANRMLEGIPQIAWTADPAGHTTYLNQRWFDFSGQQPDALSTLQWNKYMHAADLPAAQARWQESLRTGQPFETEFRFWNKTGAFRWMLGRALPSRSSEGEIMQWIGTCTDIHEHKLAQERIDHAQRQLQENNERLTRVNIDLDNFIYSASHDLKAPINNIEGLLHALLSELPASTSQHEQVQPILHHMQDSVDRFKRTIEHLTEVTKLQKENDQPIAQLDVAAIVHEILLDLQPLIVTSEAQMEIELPACPAIPFSEKNLRSVVYNLLSNALKYRSPDRSAHVRLQHRVVDGYTVLDVHDNGLGLNLTNTTKLFTMFQRFHDHVEGTGIGLYMVKKIMENAGGRIEVMSELGRGSTFSAYFRQEANNGSA
ncbi:PAS domain-containing sensor histidine kinase [Hymenobacter seoulensis]